MSEGPRGDVLFVGSAPGKSAEEVFRRCARAVGTRAFAFPDGELGPRQTWVGGLGEMVYSKHPDLERIPAPSRPYGTYAPRPGADVSFDGLYPYTAFAIESYQTFRRLRDAGEIPTGVRFQVSLPTSYAALCAYIPEVHLRRELLEAWAHAMRRGYDEMLTEIPAEDLAIQLDYCGELVDIHGDMDNETSLHPGGSREDKIRTYTELSYIAPMSANLPEAAALGYHLCAGAWPQWPVSALADMSLVVALANRLIESTPRRIDFLHLPVMSDAQEAYFEPLRDLKPGPRIFLGLECRDGVEQLRRRIDAAQRHLSDFGIAHFCGYGRAYADQVDQLLEDLAIGADDLHRKR